MNIDTPYLTIGLANMSSQKSSSSGPIIIVIDVFMLTILCGMTLSRQAFLSIKYQLLQKAVVKKVIRMSAGSF